MAYKYEMVGIGVFTKDGHTMFSEDVLRDLQRKSFLEDNKIKLEQQNEELRNMIKDSLAILKELAVDESPDIHFCPEDYENINHSKAVDAKKVLTILDQDFIYFCKWCKDKTGGCLQCCDAGQDARVPGSEEK